MRRSSVLAFAAGCVLLLAACSSAGDLDAQQRATAAELVDRHAARAMIELSEDDRTCAVGQLSAQTVGALDTEGADLRPLADAVVGCVGESLIAASVLRSQIGSVDSESLDCAVAELDRTFVVDLVAGEMDDSPLRAKAEIEVARALALCLDLDELLDRQ